MREATGTRLTAVIRVALLSLLAATAWLILSFATASSSALATDHSNAPSLGLFGHDSNEADSPLQNILSTATKPVTPVIETVLIVVDAPAAAVVDLVGSSPAGNVVGGVTDTLGGIADVVSDGVFDLVGGLGSVVDGAVNELVGNTVDDVLTDFLSGADDVEALRNLLASPSHPMSAAPGQSSLVGASGQLRPASPLPQPWDPVRLVLTGSGALTNASAGGGASPACDLPSARQWSGIDAALGDRSPNDELPSSTTFDTDSTPD